MSNKKSITKESFYDALYNASTDVKVVEKDATGHLYFLKSVYTFDLNDKLISVCTMEITGNGRPNFHIEEH